MDFKHLTDDKLEETLLASVAHENEVTVRVLHLLAEVERRRLFSKREHPSLYIYCVKVLKYSNGKAQRRIDSMRAMKLIPEIEEKILSGDLNLSNIYQAQSFFRQEEKQGHKYSVPEKKELLASLENKSSRECIETLVAISPKSVPKERRTVLSPTETEVKVVLQNQLVARLDKLKGLLSHKHPYMTDAQLIEEMASLSIDQLDPARKKARTSKIANNRQSKVGVLLPAPVVNSEKSDVSDQFVNSNGSPISKSNRRPYISVELKRRVWERDQSQCTFPGCNSKHFLQIDHVQPFAMGGSTGLDNLRLLCRPHNQQAAINKFGISKMQSHWH